MHLKNLTNEIARQFFPDILTFFEPQRPACHMHFACCVGSRLSR